MAQSQHFTHSYGTDRPARGVEGWILLGLVVVLAAGLIASAALGLSHLAHVLGLLDPGPLAAGLAAWALQAALLPLALAAVATLTLAFADGNPTQPGGMCGSGFFNDMSPPSATLGGLLRPPRLQC